MGIRVSSILLAPQIVADWQPEQIISLLDPETQSPDVGEIPYLNLSFDDVEVATDMWAPNADDILSIFSFLKPDTRVLVFCNGGISRSSAVGIGILVSRGMTIASATEYVHEQRPNISPNKLLLRLIDAHLDLHGELIQQVAATMTTFPLDLMLYCSTCKQNFLDDDPHTCPGWNQ